MYIATVALGRECRHTGNAGVTSVMPSGTHEPRFMLPTGSQAAEFGKIVNSKALWQIPDSQ